MIFPLPLPDWVPPWGQLVILVAVLLFGLMFLMMPFAVFGVKGRLDTLEARLDEIQGEIRSLSLRLPEPGRDDGQISGGQLSGIRDRYVVPDAYGGQRPPIPPAPRERPAAAPPARTEPRLY